LRRRSRRTADRRCVGPVGELRGALLRVAAKSWDRGSPTPEFDLLTAAVRLSQTRSRGRSDPPPAMVRLWPVWYLGRCGLLQAIYKNKRVPLSVRMRAATIAIQYETPRLAVTGVLRDDAGFAAALDRAIARSNAKVIELKLPVAPVRGRKRGGCGSRQSPLGRRTAPSPAGASPLRLPRAQPQQAFGTTA
jgi:hypothetical protein